MRIGALECEGFSCNDLENLVTPVLDEMLDKACCYANDAVVYHFAKMIKLAVAMVAGAAAAAAAGGGGVVIVGIGVCVAVVPVF